VNEKQLTLTDAERQFLVQLLENVLSQKYVEEHRTRTPSYREDILRQEATIEQILKKLR